MSQTVEPLVPSREIRRRRLATLAAAGACMIAVAAAVDPVSGVSGPGAGTSATGGSAGEGTTPENATAPPWVWRHAPSDPAPLPATPGIAPVITRIDTTDPVVFLTIDDGHDRSPEAAAALRDVRIPASLFLLDGPVETDAAWFSRLPGTVVESHTRTHPDMTTMSESAQRAEICGNADLIERHLGRRPVLFRPPYGRYDEATRRAAAACGMRAIVLWQETVNDDAIAFREVPRIRPGDIILVHFRPALRHELTVIRDRVQAAGLHFALLEDYLVPDTVPAGRGGPGEARETSCHPVTGAC